MSIHVPLEDDAMVPSCSEISALVLRVQSDYLDTPGLTLTLHDARRRFGVDEATCEAILEVLVDAGVLSRTRKGAYVRFFPRLVPRTARANASHTERSPRPTDDGVRRFAEHAA
jgi:hypothetical protein